MPQYLTEYVAHSRFSVNVKRLGEKKEGMNFSSPGSKTVNLGSSLWFAEAEFHHLKKMGKISAS